MATANTFIKGLTQDISPLKFQQDQYYNMTNFRVVTDDGLSTGAIVNEKGMKYHFSFPLVHATYIVDLDNINGQTVTINGTGAFISSSNIEEVYQQLLDTFQTAITAGDFYIGLNDEQIRIVGLNNFTTTGVGLIQETPEREKVYVIGWTSLNDDIILFTTGNTATDTVDSDGQIWRVTFDEVTNTANFLNNGELTPSKHLKYSGCLNFSTEWAITRAETRYETEDIARVYWTDRVNSFRSFNLNDSDGMRLPCYSLDLTPQISLSQPVFIDLLDGGAIPVASKIQMAYRLIGNNKKTNFSPLSHILPIYSYDDETDSYRDIKGSTNGTDNTKAVTFQIENVDTNFSIIEYAFIIYENLNLPTIVGFSENIPPSGIVTSTFTNTESDLITYTEQEINQLITELSIVKDFTIKDNRLIAANIKTTNFEITDEEFDARTYRYDNTGTSRIYQSDNTETIVSDPSTIAFDHDAINPFNDPSHPNYAEYKYKSDGVTLGGEGVNISYEFITKEIPYDVFGDISQWSPPWSGLYARTSYEAQENSNAVSLPITNQFNNYKSPFIDAYFKGYHRDEVYRFGIVFYSKKGEVSFTKWIGDIRMPNVIEKPLLTNGSCTDADPMILNVLGVKFNVNIPDSIKTKIQGYEIVRLERDEENMTRLGGGVHLKLEEDSSDVRPANGLLGIFTDEPSNGLGWYPGKYIRYISPTTLFRSETKFQHRENDYVQFNYAYTQDNVFGGGSYRDQHIIGTPNGSTFNNLLGVVKLYKPRLYTNLPTAEINDLAHVGYQSSVFLPSIDPSTTYEYYHNTSTDPYTSGNCTIMVSDVNLNNVMQDFSNQTFQQRQIPYMTYCRNLIKQYGGNTYESRSSDKYISTHTVIFNNDTQDVNVYGGDTYVQYFMYEHLNDVDAAVYADKRSRGIAFACESLINVELRNDLNFNQDRDNPDANPTGYESYEADTYKFQSCYKQESNISEIYLPKNFLLNITTELPYSIWASEKKLNGELIDSWSMFLDNNKIEIDGNYGPINSIHNFKDKLFFYQNKAFGVAALNERSVIKDDNGTDLLIGTGDVLNDYAYVSTHTGAVHTTGVIISENNIYHFDNRQKKIYRYTLDSKLPLTDVKGLSGFFFNAFQGSPLEVLDNPTSVTFPNNVHGAYDHRYNRVLFTFNYRGKFDTKPTSYTISYNELLDSFESFYDFTPKLYLSTGRKLLSIDPDDGESVYQHNIGDVYCSYYGNEPVPSTIELIINGQSHFQKVWNNLEWLSEITTSTNDIPQTYGTLRITNEYQDTGEISLIPQDTIKRRFRTWRYQIGRDVLSENQQARIKSAWIQLKLELPNTQGYKFVGHDIISHYNQHIINDYSK